MNESVNHYFVFFYHKCKSLLTCMYVRVFFHITLLMKTFATITAWIWSRVGMY